MANKLRSNGASTDPVRTAGPPSLWQIGVVCAIPAGIAAVITASLDLEIVPHIIGAFVITLVLGLAGIMLVRTLNRRRR